MEVGECPHFQCWEKGRRVIKRDERGQKDRTIKVVLHLQMQGGINSRRRRLTLTNTSREGKKNKS